MIPNQRHLFDFPEDVTYLNCAYMGPQPKAVTEAGHVGSRRKGQPWTITSRTFFEDAEIIRGLLARMIDASPDDVAIQPSASYGIAVAAANLAVSKGESIVLLAEQFPSNVYAWRELAERTGAEIRTARRQAGGGEAGDDDGGSWTDAVLSQIDERTRVVSVPALHWTDGRRLDLLSIRARCDDVGSALVLDLSQSLGATPFSVREIRPDYMICAGYKWLLCPYGTSLMYVRPDRQDGRPIEFNWINRPNSEDFSRLADYRDEYRVGARRFDVGERSNFALLPMVKTALEQILAWDPSEISGTLRGFIDHIATEGNARGFRVPPADQRSDHFVGLELPPGQGEAVRERLEASNVYVGIRGNCLRISPHLYNDLTDLDRVFSALD